MFYHDKQLTMSNVAPHNGTVTHYVRFYSLQLHKSRQQAAKDKEK